jgi:hypothetical protein
MAEEPAERGEAQVFSSRFVSPRRAKPVAAAVR